MAPFEIASFAFRASSSLGWAITHSFPSEPRTLSPCDGSGNKPTMDSIVQSGYVRDARVDVGKQIARRQVEVDATGSATDGDPFEPLDRRVRHHRPWVGRSERGDGSAFVSGGLLGLGLVRERQPADAEGRSELGPVDLATTGDEHEDVVAG